MEASLDLTALAAEINAEHRAAEDDGHAYLRRCLLIGRHLLEAKRLVTGDNGSWPKWVDDCLDITVEVANTYVRAAHYADELANVSGITCITLLRAALADQPQISRGPNRLNHGLEKDIVADRAAGLTLLQIKEKHHVGMSTVRFALDPSERDRFRKAQRKYDARQREAKRIRLLAKKLKDNTHAVRAAGGSLETAYSQVRRLLSTLDGAISASESREVSAALRGAMAHAHRAEDEIVIAAKCARSQS